MFHRIGPAAYKPGLDNTIALMKLVGNPERKLKTVHVAGTNGKGSTSHLIASVLQEAGYKTGLYTSPHLKDFRERIKLSGEMISKEDVVWFFRQFNEKWQHLSPSFFEITVAMAFWFFEKEKVDIAVIEVGLGGRLDSTNIITPEVSVITNIGLDHVNLLGDTIEKIALEKGGIIKTGIPVVLGEMRDEARFVLEKISTDEKAAVFHSSQIETTPACELKGNYQTQNRKTALQALNVLQSLGWKISEENKNAGFAKVIRNTGLMGRWQKLSNLPLTIADVAHNEDGILAVLEQISETAHVHLHFVLGVVGDKDMNTMLKHLPVKAIYYFCKANIPRGMDAQQLQIAAATFNLKGSVFESVLDAYENAKLTAQPSDLIFIGGSVFTVAEVL